MLDTFELMERMGNLRIQKGGTAEERQRYQTALNALLSQWQRYLGEKYAKEFTPEQRAAIYEAAGDPEFLGYHEVESQYEKYATFARKFTQKPA